MTEPSQQPERDPTYDADAIIVGSGPSGVSAAFPLLAAGMHVVMLDGGKERRQDSLAPPFERQRLVIF